MARKLNALTGKPDKRVLAVSTGNKVAVIKQLCRQAWGPYRAQAAEVARVDAWGTGNQMLLTNTDPQTQQTEGMPYMPYVDGGRGVKPEFHDLASRAPAPWGKLIISSVAQTVYMESARIKGMGEDETLDCFDVLQRNRWGSRQIPMTRASVGHGIAYVKALPAMMPNGEKVPEVRPISGKRMFANYDEIGDEWPSFAIEVDKRPKVDDAEFEDVYDVKFYDDNAVHALVVTEDASQEQNWTYSGVLMVHDIGVCPIVPFTNITDLEDNAVGEIAPIIPLLRRIDQSTFDRLVVQRFGAWKVRYAAGMAEPTTDAEKRAQAITLRMNDMLVSADADTKFGTLDETPTDGYIKATDADLRVLAAVTQTPPHHLLGLSSNLQAEALAAAEAGLQRKSNDFKLSNAGSYQQLLRLIAVLRGNAKEVNATHIDIRYRDTESRSLVQASQALGTLATQLQIPPELLWNRIPDWNADDTERAKSLIKSGALEAFFQAAAAGQGAQGGQGTPGQATTAKDTKESGDGQPTE